jgi:hypothetical protein
MKQYYFNVTNEERENILDKHKTIYDGYVTEYGNNNMTPLYVVDMAKDKQGVTVNNKGEVSGYKNFGINESINEMIHDDKSTGLFSDEESNYKLGKRAKKSAEKDIKNHYYKNPFGDETGPSDKWPKHSIPNDTNFDFDNLDEQEDDMYDYDEIEKSDRLKVGPPLDMIADREDDIKHGTVDFDDDIENYDLGDIIPFDAFNDDEEEDDDDDFDFDFDPEDLMDDDDMFTLEPDNDSNEFSIDLTQDDDDSNDDEITLDLTNDFDEEDTQPIMEQVNKSLDMFKRFKKYY